MARTKARNYARHKTVKMGRREFEMKQVYVSKSTFAHMGLGLFAAEPIAAGDVISEYGGKLIDREEALRLRKQKKDTHLLTVRGTGNVLDGRVRGRYTKEWYRSHHLLASFVNDPHGTGKKTNATVKLFELEKGHVYPNGQTTNVRAFLVATRAIAQDEEIFFNYGTTYHKLHF